MNHGPVSTKYLDFQKPFANYYGKNVQVKMKSGKGGKGLLLPPIFSCLVPARKLYLENAKGRIRRLRMDNVESVEVIE
jgi:hypothetical protein